MLKPTKAFESMVDRVWNKEIKKGYECALIVLIKNETGVWLLRRFVTFTPRENADAIMTAHSGVWTRLQHMETGEFEEVTFDTKRMESIVGGGKGQQQ